MTMTEHIPSPPEYVLHEFLFNPKQPKVFEVKFSLRGIGRIFRLKYEILSFEKMPKLTKFRFPER